MGKKQQLYIKNDKGRYEPYEPPKTNVSDTLFLKVGKRYVPYGIRLDTDFLTDGVYVVRSDKRGSLRSFADAGYLQECYRIDKVSKNHRITTEQLASLEDYSDFAWRELQNLSLERSGSGYGISTYEQIACVIGSVFKFSDTLRKKTDEDKSDAREGTDAENAF